MSRSLRMSIVAASLLLMLAARPAAAEPADESDGCAAACWITWVLCVYTPFPYCNPMLEGCLAGCEFPH